MKINIACLITLQRILLTPVVVLLMLHGRWMAALLTFLVAVLTDILDGFVARACNMQSKFGQLFDPVADKILLSSVMYTLLILTPLPSYFSYAVWFLLCKEFVLLFGGAVLWLRFKKFIAPSVLSRAGSLCEVVLILALFAAKFSVFYVPMDLVLSILLLNVVLSVWLLIRYSIIIFKLVAG